MSWTMSAVGKDKADAKKKLREMNERQGDVLPAAALKVVEAAIDALPATKVDGYDAVAVSTYGHFGEDAETQTSNLNLSVQHVNSDGLSG